MRIAFCLLLAIPLLAQSDWAILSNIESGRKVKLKLAKNTVAGSFQRADQNTITILKSNQEQSHDRTTVKRVSLRTGKARARNAGLGTAIGAGIGAVLGLFVHGDLSRDISTLLLGANGAVYGAGIGALFPGYTTVYRAP